MKWYDSPLALPLSFRKLICVGVLVHLNLIRPGVATKRASRPPQGMVFYPNPPPNFASQRGTRIWEDS